MNLLNRFSAPVRFAIGILLVGAVIKLMHWPGGEIIMSVAFGLILIFYGIKVFQKRNDRTALDIVKLILISFWCIQGILSINHLPYSLYFKYGFWISLAAYGIFELFVVPEETHENPANKS